MLVPQRGLRRVDNPAHGPADGALHLHLSFRSRPVPTGEVRPAVDFTWARWHWDPCGARTSWRRVARPRVAAAVGAGLAGTAAAVAAGLRPRCRKGRSRASRLGGSGRGALTATAPAAWSRREAAIAGANGLIWGLGCEGTALAGPPAAEHREASSLHDRLLPEARLVNPRSRTGAPPGGKTKSTYPYWLFGEWEVRSTPVAFAEPLGARFVDPETRAAVREDFAPGQRKELSWQTRFYWASLDEEGVPLRRKREPGRATAQSSWGVLVAGPPDGEPHVGRPDQPGYVVQYRSFNAAQELRAFLGQRIPRVISEADPTVQPLQVWVAFPVEEGGEEVIRTVTLRLDACSSEERGDSFVSSELFRQTVSTEGEIDTVGDFEVINEYKLTDANLGRVSVRNRVAKYLVPGDPLYQEADGAAVSWLDYDWTMSRTRTCIETPFGDKCLTNA